MKRSAGRYSFVLRAHVLLILLAALAIAALSAGMRHVESGLACTDRSSCYGRIGHGYGDPLPQAADFPRAAPVWAKRSHRVLAAALVLLTLALVYRTRTSAPSPNARSIIPLLMLSLLLALAVIGPLSHLKTRPIIATFNLLGGTALVASSWQLLLVLGKPGTFPVPPFLRAALRLGLLLLALQIITGAWVSSNFAGLACHGIPGCAEASHAGSPLSLDAALNPLRELALDSNARVTTGGPARTINLVHRAGALFSALILFIACVAAALARMPVRLWMPVAALLALQCALGVATLTSTLALSVVLAHSVVATLLLLATMRLGHALEPATIRGRQ